MVGLVLSPDNQLKWGEPKCRFAGRGGMGHELIAKGIKEATGFDIPSADIVVAVRRTFLRGLALELRQGFADAEYTLPTQVLESPNKKVTLPKCITPEFLQQLKEKIWSVCKPEMVGLLAD